MPCIEEEEIKGSSIACMLYYGTTYQHHAHSHSPLSIAADGDDDSDIIHERMYTSFFILVSSFASFLQPQHRTAPHHPHHIALEG